MEKTNPSPEISIIIPNLHSPIVDQTIKSVLAQETDFSYEVIVVGQDRYGLVEKFDQVQFIKTPQPVGAARSAQPWDQASPGRMVPIYRFGLYRTGRLDQGFHRRI